ncbi:hypothetical protein LTR08_004022 [Meristemomyces frigidus]|nr:hypothetical protein LTR08_004022 [Meristemomyces frigidus]
MPPTRRSIRLNTPVTPTFIAPSTPMDAFTAPPFIPARRNHELAFDYANRIFATQGVERNALSALHSRQVDELASIIGLLSEEQGDILLAKWGDTRYRPRRAVSAWSERRMAEYEMVKAYAWMFLMLLVVVMIWMLVFGPDSTPIDLIGSPSADLLHD